MSDIGIIELDKNNTCKICNNNLAKYTCPKCNIPYCSVACYKAKLHEECSEHFYKDCVMKEIQSESTGEESQAQMMQILERFNEEYTHEELIDSDDEDDGLDLTERLENIDLNNAKAIWGSLNQDEQQEFEALVASNNVEQIIPKWEAWWEFKVKTKLVVDLEKHFIPFNYQLNCPLIMENIPEFSKISTKQPSECVKYNLINVIGAYTTVVRYFNGDYFDFASEAVYLITNISPNLESNQIFESFSLALESVYQHALANEWISVDDETKERIYYDVKCIVQGPESKNKNFYLKSALSDLYRLFLFSKDVKKEEDCDVFSKKFQNILLPTEKNIPKDKIKSILMKIQYYLSFVSHCNFNFMEC